MLHVYAVDPDALSDFNVVWQALDSCGYEHGRLIARFPSRWLARVHDARAECSPLEQKRLEVALARLRDCMVSTPATFGDGTWRANAHREQQHFRSVLQSDNPDLHGFVLTGVELHEDHPLWAAPREGVVPRTPAAISDAVGPLLQHSNDAAFVDRYYDGSQGQNSVIGACLRKLGGGSCARRLITIHTGVAASPQHIELGARHLLSSLPKGGELRVKVWSPREGLEGFHARYLLTEKGGFRVDWGFAEDNTGLTTDISLLSREMHVKRWQELTTENWSCNKVHDLHIT